jgi:hypothetical protein
MALTTHLELSIPFNRPASRSPIPLDKFLLSLCLSARRAFNLAGAICVGLGNFDFVDRRECRS